jgi:hypothetical protein
MAVTSAYTAISAPKIKAFRRLYVKRRLQSTGDFESDWVEISEDVKRWGSIKMSADTDRPGRYSIDGMNLLMHNDSGKYNPSDDINSLWWGYLSQTRTLVKIIAGLVHETLGADLIWDRTEYPSYNWDVDYWDSGIWDAEGTLYTGIVSGDINLSDKNEVALPVKSLVQVFKDFPAAALAGYSAGGMTASQFMGMLRDQTDGSGSFVFRPFFGNTTTNWEIATTTNVYSNLNAATAEDVRDKTTWDIVERLAAAENYTAFVDQAGVFRFQSKTPSSTVQYQFHGLGSFDTEYGHTIKGINAFGKDYSKFYSRVSVKYRKDDTYTSYINTSSAFVVSGTNTAWEIGYKTLDYENVWIPNSTTAATIANELHSEFSSLKNKIDFTSTFVPHLSLLNRISITYDSTSRLSSDSAWDANDWDTELTWDASQGDAIVLDGAEFKFLSIEINLDSFECKYIAREL